MSLTNVTNNMSPYEVLNAINTNFGELDSVKQTASALGAAAFKAVASAGGTSADSGKVIVLDSNGKIPNGYIGDLFSNEFFTSATKAALVNLSSARAGDFAAVTADESNGGGSTIYVLSGTYSTLADWKALKIPCSVTSVNGKTGVVVIGIGDISGLQTALNAKLATNGAGANVTVAFTQAATLANIATGESLATLMGKLSKLFASLGSMAYKDQVSTTDFATGAKAPAATSADSATSADKVAHKLTLNVDGTNTEFDGSAAKTVAVPAVTQVTFTAADNRWSTITNGYKLTISTSKKAIGSVMKLNDNSRYEDCFCGVEYASDAIYVTSNAKFAGCLYLI